MADVDVSVALTSPMLIDSFVVNRRVQSVDNFGYGSTTNTSLGEQYGVVYPSNENDRRLLPDLEVTDKCISIISRFALRAEAETVGNVEYQPDLVAWRGDNFVVRKLEDWSSYGPGFILAICSSIDTVDAPPTTE